MRRTIFDHTPDGLRQRLADMERQIADLQRVRNPPATYVEQSGGAAPLVFNWTGRVHRFIDYRNGPGEFATDGTITSIRYRWDTPSTAGATVQWRVNNSVAFTHTVSSSDPHVETLSYAYAGHDIVAVVTAVGTDGFGLSAFVHMEE